MKQYRIILSIVALFAMVQSVSAEIIVDPNLRGISEGDDISNMFEGIVLSSIGTYSGLDGCIYAKSNDIHSEFGRVFGNCLSKTDQRGTPLSQLWQQNNNGFPEFRFKADFDHPANHVEIDFIANDFSEEGVMEAYNSKGRLLESLLITFGTDDSPFTAQITRPEFDIAYIIASGINGDTILLDNLHATVPEPVTTSFLISGGLGIVRRKKR